MRPCLCVSDLILQGPLAEEWVFRCCMCPVLLAGGWGQSAVIFGTPLLFGLAHVHHLINLVRQQGMTVQQGAVKVIFQLAYTTLFGIYASFVLIRTGQLNAVFLAHAFCNVMEVPQLGWLLNPQHELAPHKLCTFPLPAFNVRGGGPSSHVWWNELHLSVCVCVLTQLLVSPSLLA